MPLTLSWQGLSLFFSNPCACKVLSCARKIYWCAVFPFRENIAPCTSLGRVVAKAEAPFSACVHYSWISSVFTELQWKLENGSSFTLSQYIGRNVVLLLKDADLSRIREVCKLTRAPQILSFPGCRPILLSFESRPTQLRNWTTSFKQLRRTDLEVRVQFCLQDLDRILALSVETAELDRQKSEGSLANEDDDQGDEEEEMPSAFSGPSVSSSSSSHRRGKI